MIELSIWKILLVLLVALMVLGPQQLSKVARTLGRALAQLRAAATTIEKQYKTMTTQQDKVDPEQEK